MKTFISLYLHCNRSSCEPEDEDFKTCHCSSCLIFVVWGKLNSIARLEIFHLCGRKDRMPRGSVLLQSLVLLCGSCGCTPAAWLCRAGGSLHMALLSRCTVLLVPALTLHLESICCPLLTVFCDPYFFMAGIIWKSSILAVFTAPYSTLYSSEQLPFFFNLSSSNYFKCPRVKH